MKPTTKDKDDLTIMFSAYPKFFKHLFEDFDYVSFGFPKTALSILTILRYRAKGEGIKMSALESHAGIKKSTLSESVDMLVKEGYIERMRSQEDRRVVKVRLTPKGKKKSDEIIESVKVHVDKKLQVLELNEKKRLFEAFKLIDRVSEKLKENE
jgi:DNA-binding MarR family transcriptional regulator